MRALTLWQPWAWLVANGHKLVENRPWHPSGRGAVKIGDRFAIHAGKQYSVGDWASLLDVCRERGIVVPDKKMLAYGAIVATAKYAGFVDRPGAIPDEKQRVWFGGPFGWLLEDVRLLSSPVECKGALNLWSVPEDVEVQVLERERSAA